MAEIQTAGGLKTRRVPTNERGDEVLVSVDIEGDKVPLRRMTEGEVDAWIKQGGSFRLEPVPQEQSP